MDTPEGYLVNLILNDPDKVEEFVNDFFPDGKPHFSVTTEPTGNDKYLYNIVSVNGEQVAKEFVNKNNSGEKFEQLLNS